MMSHYAIDELIARWKKGSLTVEQVIGQLLLLVQEHDRRLRELGRQRRAANDTTPTDRSTE
jgi:hypothetical protein